jgi:ferritin-like metal-binding protein YciE
MIIQNSQLLLIDQLRDLHNAETQVRRTLPELAAQCPISSLQEFLVSQMLITSSQVERLDQASEYLESSLEGDTCKALEGLIEGGNQHISKAQGSQVKGLIMIAHASRIYHYQVAGYRFSYALACQLETSGVADLLKTTLQEELAAIETLSEQFQQVFATTTSEPDQNA